MEKEEEKEVEEEKDGSARSWGDLHQREYLIIKSQWIPFAKIEKGYIKKCY